MFDSINGSSNGSSTLKTLRVGVVEDDATLRLFLKKLIQKPSNGFEFVGAWESAEEAAQPIAETRPHVVIVDLELPKVSGIELIRQMSPRLSNTAFVVLTIHDDPDKVFAALRAGANGYLLKSSRPNEIATGVRQASEGGSPLSQEIARLLIKSFQEPVVPQKKEIPGLTPRESQILERLAQGMVPKEVAHDLGISYETVRDYLKAVYAKLHVRSRTEAVIKYLEHQQ
ncbi:MAG: response regulator transcription factor [Prosthecobacter sp.]|uniref:response regulator n=1 Tax=Prosthecobacter sp. TaxID=1965333 RepID=UPI0019E97BED|nr:response regulator transcription factor [Prosthecobacter sp.]MBE2286266.1 response regulator transcription factor [Prosthecobacter sp.]